MRKCFQRDARLAFRVQNCGYRQNIENITLTLALGVNGIPFMFELLVGLDDNFPFVSAADLDSEDEEDLTDTSSNMLEVPLYFLNFARISDSTEASRGIVTLAFTVFFWSSMKIELAALASKINYGMKSF